MRLAAGDLLCLLPHPRVVHLLLYTSSFSCANITTIQDLTSSALQYATKKYTEIYLWLALICDEINTILSSTIRHFVNKNHRTF
jgi:ABC-type arginine/histidine transport system permease subunit